MRAEQIMRRDVTVVRQDDTLLTAARAMRERDVGFLPVVDDRGVLLGVLTDRDIVVRACVDDAPPSSVLVASVMTRGTTTCTADEPIGAAASRMRAHRITRVVVIDAERRPVGVLSLSDLSQYDHPSRTGRTLRSVAERKYERP